MIAVKYGGDVMYCEHCGNKLDDGNKFCRKCGQAVNGTGKEKSNIKQRIMICVSAGIVCVILLGVCLYSIFIKATSQKDSDLEVNNKYSEEEVYSGEVLSNEAENLETETALTGAYNKTSAIPELDEIGKKRFEEAFQILPFDWLQYEDDYLADYVMLEIYNTKNNGGVFSALEVPNVETGTGISPIDLDFDSVIKGESATYIRCNTEEMEKFLGEIYGKTYNIMQGDLINVGDGARNDDGYIYEWGSGWHTSYCGASASEITKLEFVQSGEFLTTTAEYTVETTDGDISIYHVQCQWHYNPESPLLYTRDTCEIKEEVTSSNFTNNIASNMTADEIEQERLRIKDVIAAGNVNQYILPVGTDGINWARQLDYENGELIFAYYYNSCVGDSDQRFYFKDGVMIRWVIGTSPNQINYNISDDTLPNDWYKYESECLNASVE
jgi:hypothetical protein